MKFHKVTLLGILLTSIVSLPALAIDSIFTECDTCQTDSQFYAHARSNSILNQSVYVYVMNFEDYKIKNYRATKNSYRECTYDAEPDGRGGNTQICRTKYKYSVTPASISTESYNNFDDLANKHNIFDLYVSAQSIEIPSTVVESGYEIISAGYIQSKVVDYFNGLPLKDTYREKAIALGASATKLVKTGHIEIDYPPLVFEFGDDVKAYAAFDFYDMDDQVHFKFIKIIDANGNTFDLTQANPFANKIYTFEGLSVGSWGSLYTAMRAYDLGVIGSSSKIVPKGTVIVTICSSGDATKCKSPD